MTVKPSFLLEAVDEPCTDDTLQVGNTISAIKESKSKKTKQQRALLLPAYLYPPDIIILVMMPACVMPCIHPNALCQMQE